MRKRFIALIDFSSHSEWLLTLTYKWAQQIGAEMAVVHHAIDPIPGLGEAEILSGMKRDSEERTLEKLSSFTEDVLGYGAVIKYYIDTYNVSSAVLKLEEPGTTDYLFVGMNDKTGIEKYTVGSTALQLIDEIDSIVIAMPTTMTDHDFDKLHIGIKQSYPLNETRFEELLSIASGKVKQIDFFSVLKPGADTDKTITYLQSLSARYKTEIPVSYKVIEDGDPAQAIKDYIQQNNGVLVLQKGPRGFMDIFRKFLTTEMVHHAQIPVIILP